MKYLELEIPGFQPQEVEILPAESSKDYLLRKLRLLDNEVTSLSLHGRDNLDLTKFLSTKYTFILCDEFSIEKIANDTRYLKEDLTFYLGTKLGSQKEKIIEADIYELAADLTPEKIKQEFSPYVILIERNYNPISAISLTEDFETNAGMITKTDKRTVTLQALELKPNLLMWDIGAGSGSVSIDAYKVFKIRSILFEKNEQQCTFIKNNLKNHKVAAAQLLEGNALENYGELPKPDRIFIGGGGEEVLKKITELYEELNPDGILVANIIGLENLTQAIQTIRTSGIKPVMRTIDITNYKKISENIDLSIPEPERTLFQIILKK